MVEKTKRAGHQADLEGRTVMSRGGHCGSRSRLRRWQKSGRSMGGITSSGVTAVEENLTGIRHTLHCKRFDEATEESL